MHLIYPSSIKQSEMSCTGINRLLVGSVGCSYVMLKSYQSSELLRFSYEQINSHLMHSLYQVVIHWFETIAKA